MKSKESVKIIKEKSDTVQQRFTWFLVTDQESNLFLARAVAFLMFMFPCSLYEYLSIDFPSVSPPNNTGSSQNVIILAKGEPLTVLVTLHFYYKR